MEWLEYIINNSLRGSNQRRKTLTYARAMRHLITIHSAVEYDPELDINDLCAKMKFLLATQGGTRIDPSLDIAGLCSLLESKGTIQAPTSNPTLAPSSPRVHMMATAHDTTEVTRKRLNQLCIAQAGDYSPQHGM